LRRRRHHPMNERRRGLQRLEIDHHRRGIPLLFTRPVKPRLSS
jgi:hypothetical protein